VAKNFNFQVVFSQLSLPLPFNYHFGLHEAQQLWSRLPFYASCYLEITNIQNIQRLNIAFHDNLPPYKKLVTMFLKKKRKNISMR